MTISARTQTDAYTRLLEEAKALSLDTQIVKDLFHRKELYDIRESIFQALGANLYGLGKEALHAYGLQDRIFASYQIDRAFLIGSVIMNDTPRFSLDVFQLHEQSGVVSLSQTGLLLFLSRPSKTQSYLYRERRVNSRKYVQWPIASGKVQSVGKYLCRHSDLYDLSAHLTSDQRVSARQNLDTIFQSYAKQVRPHSTYWNWNTSRHAYGQRSYFLDWIKTHTVGFSSFMTAKPALGLYLFTPEEIKRQKSLLESMSTIDIDTAMHELAYQSLRKELGMPDVNAISMDGIAMDDTIVF